VTLNGKTHQIRVAPSNQSAVEQASSVILVVKPFHAEAVLSELNAALGSKPLISAMAGVTINAIRGLLGLPNANVIRLMPNTPATIGQGTGANFKEPMVLSQCLQKQVNNICLAFGCPIELKTESQLNAVTATSGSGAAYVFLLIEYLLKIYHAQRSMNERDAMAIIKHNFKTEAAPTATSDALLIRHFKKFMKQCAVNMGLEHNDAIQLVDQTFTGAMALVQMELKHNPTDSPIKLVQQLRSNVTSKGGTTFAALECFRKQGLLIFLEQLMVPNLDQTEVEKLYQSLYTIIEAAEQAANDRAEEMAQEVEQKVNPIILK
jgi:pyrroline-5-carboxylate reductase